MDPTTRAWLIAGTALVFIVFLVVKAVFDPMPRGPGVREARRRLSEARKRARAKELSSHERSAAWCAAARLALEDLGSPRAAARLAQKALRADPASLDAQALLSRALHSAGRLRTLERALWVELDLARGIRANDAYERAFAELLSLYEGPLRRPERARVLRALRASEKA